MFFVILIRSMTIVTTPHIGGWKWLFTCKKRWIFTKL